MKNYKFAAIGLVSLLALGACASGTKFSGSIVNGVKQIDAPPVSIDEFRETPNAPQANTIEWWRNFADATLVKLVEEAQSEAISIKIAEARLKEARNQGRATIAGFAPRLDISYSTNKTTAIDGPELQNAVTGGDEKTQTTGTGVLAASWELPLFGRLPNSLEGAKANVANAEIGVAAAKIALVSDLAAAYIDLRTAQTRLQYLEEDYARAKTLLDIANDRLRVGLVSKSDASFAQTNWAAIGAQLPDAKLMVRAGLNRVAILRGLNPGALDETLAPISNYAFNYSIPKISEIPADYVRRRPDVRQAEQNAILMGAAVGLAKADFFPRVSIGGTISALAAISGNPLAESITRGIFNPSVSLPLFDFGQRTASLGQAKARFDTALLGYKNTVLLALAEGQQALSTYVFSKDRLEAAHAAETAATTRFKAAQKSLEVGLVSMKDYVETERDYSQARQQRLAAQAAYSDAAIGLYRAFAGSPEII